MAARSPASLSYRTTGSTCLHPLSQLLGIPLDQVNFVACQLLALSAAFWFRIYLRPGKASPEVRHTLATILGIYFVVFCFGWYAVHLFVLVLMCYGVMVTASVSNIHRYSFFVAMGYLTICHISRIYIFHYGILTTDFSGIFDLAAMVVETRRDHRIPGAGIIESYKWPPARGTELGSSGRTGRVLTAEPSLQPPAFRFFLVNHA